MGIDFSTSSEELYKLQIWAIKLNKKIRTEVAEIFQGTLNFLVEKYVNRTRHLETPTYFALQIGVGTVEMRFTIIK